MKRLSVIAALALCASLALAFSVGSGESRSVGNLHLPSEGSAASAEPGAVAPGPTVIVVMENKSYTKVANLPYLKSFAAGGVRYSNYVEASSVGPSLPDYLQLTAGSSCGKTSDDVHAPDATIQANCPTQLWSQLTGAGLTWGVYAEGMPSPCYKGVTYVANHDQYALKHVPAPQWGLCASPLSGLDPLALPDVSFVVPTICNDMHGSKATWAPASCYPGSAALLKRGDDWLAAHVPPMLDAGATVFVTFDEAGKLYAAMQYPGITPGLVTGARNHYDWLAFVEDRYGLPRLRGAVGRPGL